MSGGRITVTEPNGVTRTMPITTRGLTIGRGDDNDLMIAYAAVSRHHARLTFDIARGHYYVTDLNSANGSYLGNNRLEPNIPTVWMPGQPLRIDDVLIHLEQTARTAHGAEGGVRIETETMPRTMPKTQTDTFVGFQVEEEQKRKGKEKSRSLVRVLIALVVLLFLAALCAAAYYFLL